MHSLRQILPKSGTGKFFLSLEVYGKICLVLFILFNQTLTNLQGVSCPDSYLPNQIDNTLKSLKFKVLKLNHLKLGLM